MMAKPIHHIEKRVPTKAEEQAEAIGEIISLIANNREAITTSLEILQELHSTGVLDAVKGLLKTREKVGVLAMGQLNQPNMHNTIKNAINMVKLVGEMDPEKVNTLMSAVMSGLDQMGEQDGKVSKWRLIKSMNDPDVLASIATMTGFLQGMGKEFNTNQKSFH